MLLFLRGSNGRSFVHMTVPFWSLLLTYAKTYGWEPSEPGLLSFSRGDRSKSAPRPRRESWFDPWPPLQMRPNQTSACYSIPTQEEIAFRVNRLGSASGTRQESWFDPWGPAVYRADQVGACHRKQSHEVKPADAFRMGEALERASGDIEDDDVVRRVRLFIHFCRESDGFTITMEGPE